ncbi:DnaB helicase C-terminal domain-containing protein [Paenibacillus melissococcoides]|uniref:DnaB helicase C-terminal domain-containing protein n=1 Tax=Paenibacillus melissococcoides TaxID=2912268 RepID=A0ABM9GCB2_9BACL|nr:DnaB helicase C-terminal domain-containing protein [Paenibacillus melissococcoides]CAH8249740.1 DnaB helicase C-terminal domain-containing protein [Paenibacillus melissococcoides]CAH8721831.1 DnaB helicase C-terminal domain-containing protein [Paenibacillus melissococcoides]
MSSYTESNARETQPHEELLGGFLTDPTLFEANRHVLTADLFQEYAWLYRILLQVHDSEGLTFKGIVNQCETEQIPILHELRKTFFNENRVPMLIRQLKKEKLAENITNLAHETYMKVQDGEDSDEILRDIQSKVFMLETSESSGMHDPAKDVDEWAEYMMTIVDDPSKAYGLMTGLQPLDSITTGFHRQYFSVIGARTSMGKTAFTLEIVKRLNASGYKCGIFSLEMMKRQLYNRFMSSIMQVNFEQFRTGRLARNHYETMMKKKDELKSIYVDDTRGVSADYIVDSMRRLKRTQGLDFVVVDYLQDVKERGEQNDNGGSALARVCRKLRAAAKECDCHVMGLSQVVRGVDDRQDKRPGNADLAGSTGIETSADVIAMLYRDEYYNRDTEKKSILEVNFTKQRNGKLGTVELLYDRSCQRIYEITR